MNPRHFVAMTALAAVSVASCTPPDAGRTARLLDGYLRIVDAEDARPSGGAGLNQLLQGAGSDITFLRQAAVRALGRLENPELVTDIAPALTDPAGAVRAEAANALAQAVHRVDGDEVARMILERVGAETDAQALAAMARSMARAATAETTRRDVSAALVSMSRDDDGDAPETVLVGVALAFESLVRRSGGQGLDGASAARVRELMSYNVSGAQTAGATRIRTLAVRALGMSRRLSGDDLLTLRRDRAWTVRHAAAGFIEAAVPPQRPEAVRRNLADPEPQLSLAAVQWLAGQPRTEQYCTFLFATGGDRVPPMIRVPGLQALGEPCPQVEVHRELLRSTAARIDTAAAGWHAASAAMVSLAERFPAEAAPLLGRYVGHGNPFVRVEGARAARTLGRVEELRTLFDDDDANVRVAALQGLAALGEDGVRALAVEALADDAPQTLMAAASLLEGAPDREGTADALLGAFERISAYELETWYDARSAILTRVAELGSADLAPRLEPFLSDYDARIATSTAELLEAWTGQPRTTSPEPLPRAPVASPAELARMVGGAVALHMEGGGEIVIAIHPLLATTNVTRFVRLVDSGYFDGLTFHRWAPNFVIQGGGPGANEYVGDGPYSRDEVSLQTHWRGTVGISTRGRDTGDAQLFVNLVDNARLDHDYTIVGTVVQGMDVVDRAMAGAVIERAEFRRPE